MVTSVLAKIRTKLDLEYLSGDLENLRQNLFKVHDNDLDIPFIIKDEFLKAPDKSSYLEAVKNDLLSARILELTTAIYLDEKSVNKISAWVKREVGQDIILDININPEIMAGVNITFQGKFKDYSLGAVFEATLASI